MERGRGNKVKNSYRHRKSPLREPISAIIAGVSALAGAVNKSNAKSKAASQKKIDKGIKMDDGGMTKAKTGGMDAAKTAMGAGGGGMSAPKKGK